MAHHLGSFQVYHTKTWPTTSGPSRSTTPDQNKISFITGPPPQVLPGLPHQDLAHHLRSFKVHHIRSEQDKLHYWPTTSGPSRSTTPDQNKISFITGPPPQVLPGLPHQDLAHHLRSFKVHHIRSEQDKLHYWPTTSGPSRSTTPDQNKISFITGPPPQVLPGLPHQDLAHHFRSFKVYHTRSEQDKHTGLPFQVLQGTPNQNVLYV